MSPAGDVGRFYLISFITRVAPFPKCKMATVGYDRRGHLRVRGAIENLKAPESRRCCRWDPDGSFDSQLLKPEKYQKLMRTVYILSNKFFECFNNSNSLMAVLRPEIINFYSIRKVKQCWVRSIFGWVAAEQVALSLPLNNRNL
jgi:hypothetical protein